MSIDPAPINPDPLQQRLSLLEKENAQLRADVQDMTRLGVGKPVLPPRDPNAPFFRPLLFQRKLSVLLACLLAPMALVQFAAVIVQAPQLRWLSQYHLGAIRVFDFGGVGTRHPGLGLGLFSFGAIGLGVIGVGGLGVGMIAFGGGAIGLVAIGGGSVGVIAIGGGSCGVIAIGGGPSGCMRWGSVQRGDMCSRPIGRINRRLTCSRAFFHRCGKVCVQRCRSFENDRCRRHS